MPFTPLHFGPALAVGKIVGKKRFGMISFALTQILFDIEPGIRILLKLDGPLHATTHNLSFGLLYGIVSLALLWKWERTAAIAGAVFGVVSHLGLDILYHSDVAENFGIAHSSIPTWIPDPENVCFAGFAIWIVLVLIEKRGKQKI